MPSVTVEKEINAPVERVFEIASDFPNAATTIRGITKMEVVAEGPIGVGTKIKETRKMHGMEATETMEIKAFEAPHHYSLGCVSCGCDYLSEFRFSPTDSGTKVKVDFTAVPLTFFAKMMAFMMKPMIKSCAKALDEDLEDIKNAAEAADAVA